MLTCAPRRQRALPAPRRRDRGWSRASAERRACAPCRDTARRRGAARGRGESPASTLTARAECPHRARPCARRCPLDREPHTVVGVLPNQPAAWFGTNAVAEVWTTKPFVIPGFSRE